MTESVNNQPPPADYQKWVYEIGRQDAHRAHDRNLEFQAKVNESTIKSADAALRAALLINGGAGVSVLAFIGGLVSQRRVELAQLADVSGSLMLFAFGVATAVAGMGLSYITHYVTVEHARSFVHQWQHPYLLPGPKTVRLARIKITAHVLATIAGVGCLLLFILGMLDVQQAIIGLGRAPIAQ